MVSGTRIEQWPIDKLVFYARNPRKNDSAVDRMCGGIREFGFKIPVLARSDGEIVDGHLRLKAARKLGSWPGGDITAIPVILYDEWMSAQVKVFRLMVNRSVTWADWDEDLLSLELQELNASDFDLSLTASIPERSTSYWLFPKRRRPTPFHPFRRILCLGRATCGSAESTGSSAATRPVRRLWRNLWEIANRS